MREDCAYYEELINRRLDGALTEPEARALSAHLRTCADCRALYGALSAVTLSLRDETAEPPPDFAEGVMARVHAGGADDARPAVDVRPAVDARHAARRVRRWPRLAAAACLAVALGLGAYTALRGGAGDGTRLAATESAEYAPALDAEEAPQTPEPAPEMAEEGLALGALTEDMELAADAPMAAAEAAEPDEAHAGPDALTLNDEDSFMAGAAAEPGYTRDNPAAVPAGREADFEALLRDARRSADAEDWTVIAAVEYRGVIYEFLTDAQQRYLLWQDAAEGAPVLSPASVDDLWDILYG